MIGTSVRGLTVCAILLVCAASASGEPRVWTGLDTTFTKEADSDWTSVANQDRITDKVWITRGDKKGIFNIAQEPGYKPSAPSGTEWAYGSAADWQTLRFHSWETWNSRIPPGTLDLDAVLHLVEADVYLDIKFTSWTQDATGGGFTYVRATEGVPGEKVWTGATITFTKKDYADWTDAANQDRINDDVWITRRDKEGIFNIAKEREYRLRPPSWTEWALGAASDWATLDFVSWEDLHEGDPADLVGKAAVLHLIKEDVYIDIEFLSWNAESAGSGFSYERATERIAGEKVWSGSLRTFTRPDHADWTESSNQDRITENVWITRGRWDGIFNIANEEGYRPYPPKGTEWAYGSAADWETLVFRPWDDLHDKKRWEILDKDAVVHLIEEDIYLDIRFTSWSQDDTGGGFAYERAMNHPVKIVSGPTATPSRISFAGGNTSFSVVAEDGDNDPLTYDWDFGDGQTGSGAVLNHRYTASGDYTATVTVSDGSVEVRGSVGVTVNAPPTIDSGPTAAPDFVMVGDEVAFSASASDLNDDPLTYAWDFGDDSSATGSTANHTYAVAGVYEVKLKVSDALDVTPGEVGVSVANELAIGSLKGKLNFKKPGADALSIKGALDLAPEFTPAGREFRLDVGGVEATFTLDEKGKAKSEAGSAKLKWSKKSGAWGFKVSLKKGTFADQWVDEGLVNDTVKGTAVDLRALVTVGGVPSVKTVSISYTGKAGKSGKFK